MFFSCDSLPHAYLRRPLFFFFYLLWLIAFATGVCKCACVTFFLVGAFDFLDFCLLCACSCLLSLVPPIAWTWIKELVFWFLIPSSCLRLHLDPHSWALLHVLPLQRLISQLVHSTYTCMKRSAIIHFTH